MHSNISTMLYTCMCGKDQKHHPPFQLYKVFTPCCKRMGKTCQQITTLASWTLIPHAAVPLKLYIHALYKITQARTSQATHHILNALAFNPKYRYHGTNTYTYLFFYNLQRQAANSYVYFDGFFPYSGKPPGIVYFHAYSGF